MSYNRLGEALRERDEARAALVRAEMRLANFEKSGRRYLFTLEEQIKRYEKRLRELEDERRRLLAIASGSER